MMYVDFEAGNKAYKLRLNTRNIVSLEKVLGCNPLAVFGEGNKIPTVSAMIAILHAAAQQYEHKITANEAADIFDAWLADGHTMVDFIPVILDIYRVSGLISEETDEKN
jgi:hypothetical protein